MSATHGHKLKFFRNCLHILLQFLPPRSLSLIPEDDLEQFSVLVRALLFFYIPRFLPLKIMSWGKDLHFAFSW